jgi:hypothetical protein
VATGGTDRAVYKKLIEPFMNDLPTSHFAGFRRVCTDDKYAYYGPNIMNTNISLLFPCQMVPIPGMSYREPWAFILSKNSTYKGLINWM